MVSQRPVRRIRTVPWLVAIAAVVATGPVLATPAHADAPSSSGTATYYVDSVAGHDTATGRSPTSAWQSLEKINGSVFHGGDRILLKAGDTWQGQLWPKGSGIAGRSVTIDRYGSGAKPRIDGAGKVDDAVRLFNQQYWEVRNLEVTNTVPPTDVAGENLADLRGIHVSGDDSQTLSHFVIDGVDVHDVSGQVNWIGGSISDNAPGVRWQTGWDGSKKTGGIIFDTTVPDVTTPPATPTILNDVVVQRSTITNTSFAGIVVKQYTGDGKDASGNTMAKATGWGTRKSASDPAFAPHTNITIRDNYITQAGTAYGCDAIYLTNVRGAVVDHNVIERAGTSGIETYLSDNVVIQHNEVYNTEKKAGGADANGIDADKGTTRVVVQYNWSHNNGDGILLCQFAFGDVVVRYNVITQNSRYPLYLHSDKAAVAEVYNNTVYNTTSNYLVYGYGSSLASSYTLSNNLLFSDRAGARLTTSPTIHYSNNFYGGAALAIPAEDTAALTGDPLLRDPAVTGPYGTALTGPQLRVAGGYAPAAGSPLIDHGMRIASNGGQDFAGTHLYQGKPDIGAFEYLSRASRNCPVAVNCPLVAMG